MRALNNQNLTSYILPKKTKQQHKNAAHDKRISAQSERLWWIAKPANPEHKFLVDNNLQPHSLRQLNDKLVVPLVDIRGEIWSLAYIDQNGFTRVVGNRKGIFSAIGNLETPEHIFIVCDWKAGAYIFQDIPHSAVFCAMATHNLYAVAEAVRRKWRNKLIIVAPDSKPARVWKAAKSFDAIVVTESEVRGIK